MVIDATPALEGLFVLAAGFLAGAINVVVGAGTLVSFPALILLGYPPLTAAVSNAIGIVPGSIMGAIVYRDELRRRRDVVRTLLPASIVGGVLGSLLLLHLSSAVFSAVIPWLIGVGTLLVLLGPTLKRWATRGHTVTLEPQPLPAFPSQAGKAWSIVGAFCLGTYGGYFSAAQGVLLIAVLGLSTTLLLQELNAIKNLAVAAVNLIAATTFLVVSPTLIAWHLVALIALGSALGGFVGGRFAKRLPAPVFRAFVVAVGVATVIIMIVKR